MIDGSKRNGAEEKVFSVGVLRTKLYGSNFFHSPLCDLLYNVKKNYLIKFVIS